MQSAGLFATMSFIVEIKTMQNGVRALNTSEKWPKYSPTNKKQSAVDIVINRIVDDVLTGRYKPGDKLPTEMQLAEMMSMSKNTVREAIKILVAYGAVEIRRPEGTFITHSFTPKMLNPVIYSLLFSKSNADDLLGLRRMIVLSHFQIGKNIFFNRSRTDHQVVETGPFLTKAVNTLLGLLPQFRTLGNAEINDFVGKLEVAAHCTGLILNEGNAVVLVAVSIQVLFFTGKNRHRAVQALGDPLQAFHFFREVIEHDQAIFRAVRQIPEGFITGRVV